MRSPRALARTRPAPSSSPPYCRLTGTYTPPLCDGQKGAMSNEILVFAGDSVTDCGRRTDPEALGDGYVRNLWNDLGPQRPRIVNVGISGNRAVDLRERWATDVLAHEPDMVSVLIGINDTWRRYDEDDPTSTEDFEAAYRAILEPVQAKLVLVEPFLLAVKEEQREWREDLDPKIEVVRRLADEFDALLVPADVEFNRQAKA